jgi:DNA/RNA non-specific endonuclease
VFVFRPRSGIGGRFLAPDRLTTPREATWKIGSFRRSGAGGGKGSVFTGPVFQESDPVYQGVKVPVAFYKVVAVVDDAEGQLSVTAFQMD